MVLGCTFWNKFFLLSIILIKAMAKFWCMCQVPLVASGTCAYGFLDQPLKVPQVVFCMFQCHLYLWRAVLSAAGIVTDDRPVRFMSSYNNKKHKLQNQFDCHKCQFSRLLDLDLSSQWSDNSEAEEIEVFVLLPLSPIAFQPPKKHNTLISFSLKTCMGHKLRWFCKNSSTISKNKIWRLVQEGAPLCHLCDELVPKVLATETLE